METDGQMTAFVNFIATCTPSQRSYLTQALAAVTAYDAASPDPSNASFMSATAGITKKGKKGKKGKKDAISDQDSAGAKRPLNSFMAFRNYYLASLAPHTQKDISRIIKEMWPADPFKAKWVMLAKAYSILRSTRTREEVPLNNFFAVCAPLIGIIPPEEYQFTMGWFIDSPRVEGQEGADLPPQVVRLFVPDLNMLPESYTTTSVSVDDLVRHCHQVGYVTEQISAAAPTSATESLTMAVQPWVQNSAEKTLVDAALALDSAGATYPYNAYFDPDNKFDITFDPNADEDGRWDAFDPSAMCSVEIETLDWNDYVNNDDHIV